MKLLVWMGIAMMIVWGLLQRHRAPGR